MSTRREVIAAGLAAAAPLAPAGAALAKAAAPAKAAPPEPAIYKAIYDDRFPTGERFAAGAIARGWAVTAIQGDVTAVWFHDLSLRWKKGAAAIAGATTESSLWVLDMLARDVGMRVQSRSRPDKHGLVTWLIAPPERSRK